MAIRINSVDHVITAKIAYALFGNRSFLVSDGICIRKPSEEVHNLQARLCAEYPWFELFIQNVGVVKRHNLAEVVQLPLERIPRVSLVARLSPDANRAPWVVRLMRESVDI